MFVNHVREPQVGAESVADGRVRGGRVHVARGAGVGHDSGRVVEGSFRLLALRRRRRRVRGRRTEELKRHAILAREPEAPVYADHPV
jgi:hypothetical protein